jgi:hypothetical protein
MNEPARLHIEPESELERSLLNAGRSYTASSTSRAKVLAALGVVGVGVTASSATAASAMTKAGAVKWLAATALLAGVAIPTVRYLAGHAAPASSSVSALTANSAPASAALPPSATAPARANESLPNASDPAAAEPAVNGASGAARVESKPPPASALAAELSALDTVRSALAAGNPAAALSGLDAYAHNFPHGKLSLEAEVLRIDALAKSGQAAAAQKRAQAFMKRHPDSMLASRVRAYVGQ